MIILDIGFHATTSHVHFGDDRAAAQAELDKLTPLIGRDRWGKNGKEDEPTHTIKAPMGDVVVVLEKVQIARLRDTSCFEAEFEAEKDKEHQRALDQDFAYRQRLAAVGLLHPPK